MRFLDGISTLADQFDALLLDLWGCVHDGTSLYPGARECLTQAHAAGKQILFLSNAPRRAVKAQVILDMLGVPREVYRAVVTSGEVAHIMLADDASLGLNYLFIGPERDADVLVGLPYRRVDSVAKADFLLNAGFGTEAQSSADWHGVLADAAARTLPMICLNPDLEVVKITGEIYPCAGVLAADYAALGGEVRYFGKPYPDVYAHSLRLLAPLPRARVLAVGDGLHTDILGAKRAGIASVLITGGILSHMLGNAGEAETLAFLEAQDVQPEFVLPALRW